MSIGWETGGRHIRVRGLMARMYGSD